LSFITFDFSFIKLIFVEGYQFQRYFNFWFLILVCPGTVYYIQLNEKGNMHCI
jgi:hypothetical protein